MILTRENQSALRETCCSATLSTTKPTLTGLDSDPGVRGERPATKPLSHGTTACVRTLAVWAVTCVDGEAHVTTVYGRIE
jgi:hypothetical protein